MKTVRIILKYITYRLKSKTKHAVHSPFVFDFITQVLEDQTHYREYKTVEKHVRRLRHNRNSIETVDFGARKGRMSYTTSFRRVQEIAKTNGIPRKYGRLLFRIVRYFKPASMLELGTSVGISTMYQALGAPEAAFTTIEGCASTGELAQKSFDATGCKNVNLVMGNFDIVLSKTLAGFQKMDYAFIDGNHAYKPTMNYFRQIEPYMQNNGLLIIHDIHWSKDMEKAWEEVCRHPRVTVTIDLFFMGLVFFRKELSKQDFIIRY